MTKEEIFNYVMNTPENTNPAVLESMLDNLSTEPELFVLDLSINDDEELECEQTYEEILEAYNNGYRIVYENPISEGYNDVPFNDYINRFDIGGVVATEASIFYSAHYVYNSAGLSGSIYTYETER